jgi:hypothetical protein
MWGCYNIKIGDIIWVKYSSGLFKCLLDEIQAVQISILEDR